MIKQKLKCITIIAVLFIFVSLLIPNQKVYAAAIPEITSGKTYLIINQNSLKCLNVNYGTDANGTNVTQYLQDGSTEQKFKLRYYPSRDAYNIYAICSSNGTNRVVDVLRTGGSSSGNIVSGNNVDIWTPDDNDAQDFVIVGNAIAGYEISLRSNDNLMLTAYGTGNGSGAGTSSTSEGNVFVSNYQGTLNQLWYIEDSTIYSTPVTLGWDLVDSGKHLDWGGNSKYSSLFETATNKWNAYKSGVIRKDILSTIQDVTISDTYDSTDEAYATTYQNGTIVFNTYQMDKKNSNFQLMICIHELGHALGLGDRGKNGNVGGYAAIMYGYNINNVTKTELTAADKISYDAAYANY